MNAHTVLIIGNDPVLQRRLKLVLESRLNTVEVDTEQAMVQFFHDNAPALVIVGSCESGCKSCLRSIELVRQLNRKVPVILVAKEGSEELAVAAFRAGATDYIRHPFTDIQLAEILQRNES